MAITSGDVFDVASNLANEEIKPLSADRLKEMEWPKIYDSKKSMKRVVQLTQRESMTAVHIKPEGVDADEMKPNEGFKCRTTQRVRGGSLVITAEADWYDEANKIGEAIKDLKMSFDQEEEIVGAAGIELGLVTNPALVPDYGGFPIVDSYTADGLPLFHTAHRHKSQPGRTYANRVNLASLNTETMEAVLQSIDGWTDSAGAYLTTRGKTLVVPRNLYFAAVRLLKSDLAPGTADNDANAIRERLGMHNVVVLKYLQNQSNWYLLTDSANRPQRRYAKDRVRLPDDVNNRAGSRAITFISSYSQKWPDPHAIFGVANAISA